MSTARKTCDISVIIPTLNEAAVITDTVSVLAGLPGIEVLVADGGSGDRTAELAAAAGAQVIESRPGRGSQLNAGAAAASGDILLFLHADTILPGNFRSLVADSLAQPEVVAGAFRFAVAAAGKRFRLLERFTNCRAKYLQLPYGDQAIFLTRKQFREAGSFREMELLEDLDLMLRLRSKGRIALTPEAATTSARRWRKLGLIRTTLVNQLILIGYFCGASPGRLARWYGKYR